jgi:hypothetical protein
MNDEQRAWAVVDGAAERGDDWRMRAIDEDDLGREHLPVVCALLAIDARLDQISGVLGVIAARLEELPPGSWRRPVP